MSEYTAYQQEIIKRYYENRDQIDVQKLAESVANLYLSEGKKRAKYWETVSKVLKRLGMKEEQVQHIVSQDDPTILAEIVNDLQ